MAFEDFISPEPNSGCWLWAGGGNYAGYGMYKVRGKTMHAHRHSYSIAHPHEDISGKVIMHKCDNRACVNPDHLASGSQSDNVQDMLRKGRGNYAKGETHCNAVLTESDVVAIRNSKASLNEDARRFGIHRSAIWAIRHRLKWKHVDG